MKSTLRNLWYKIQDATRQRWSIQQYRRSFRGTHGSGLIGYTCFAGLANRVQAHAAALAISRHSGLPVVPIWPKNKQCGAAFDEIFSEQPLAVQPCFEEVAVIPVQDCAPAEIPVRLGMLNLLDFRWQYFDSFPWIERHGDRDWVLEQLEFSKAVTERLATRHETDGRAKLGVHIRRGDFVTHTPYARPTTAYVEEVRRLIAQLSQSRPTDDLLVYLATDGGDEVREEFRGLLPEVSVLAEQRRPAHDDTAAIRDAVSDVVELSECDALVLTGQSSFGKLARFFARRPQIVATVG